MNKRKSKNPYETAEVEIVLFEFSDVIRTSGEEFTSSNMDENGWTRNDSDS